MITMIMKLCIESSTAWPNMSKSAGRSVTRSVDVGMYQPKLVVGLAIYSPSYHETIVACAQSKVGDTVFHSSVIGTSFQRMALDEYSNGDMSKVISS